MLPRVLEPETLDHLAPDDPHAMRSRRDLRRVNRVMGARSILATAMRLALPQARASGRALKVVEIGCGDGRLMLGVARALRGRWPRVELTLLDRQPIVDAATIAAYAKHGWHARARVADVLEWAASRNERNADIVVTNLFLHHFESAQLSTLFSCIARRKAALVACEPRRGRLALAASHLVGVIGANAVTRRDAVLSVRAGFIGHELSDLWSGATMASPSWQLREHAAALFSHVFVAAPLPASRRS